MESLNDNIILTIIDKLIIGLFIVIIGMFANKYIERFKSKQALYSELAKEKIKKIGECWQLAYEFEALIKGMVRKAAEIQVLYIESKEEMNRKLIEEVGPAEERSKKLSNEFQMYVEKNRFWLGRELSDKFQKFHNTLMDYLDGFQEGNSEKLKTAEKYLNENFVSITEFIKH